MNAAHATVWPTRTSMLRVTQEVAVVERNCLVDLSHAGKFVLGNVSQSRTRCLFSVGEIMLSALL